MVNREMVVVMVQREVSGTWTGQRLDAPAPRLSGTSRESIERQIHQTWIDPDPIAVR